jgi:predicted nucleotidyltransferase
MSSDSLPARLQVSSAALAAYCRRHRIRVLSFFGSVLRDDYGPQSDIDVLVEFEPGFIPGLEFITMRDELARLLGRPVDLNTRNSLSPYVRDAVLREAELAYAAP